MGVPSSNHLRFRAHEQSRSVCCLTGDEGCEEGYYFDGTACTACTAMEGASFVICTTADDSYAAECESGYYNLGWYYEEENGCAVCPAVEHAAAVSCLGPDDSRATMCHHPFLLQAGACVDSCDSGFFQIDETCIECTPVYYAATVTCSDYTDSVAASAVDGYYLDGTTPTECDPIDNAAMVTCTAAGNSVALAAVEGYFMDGGTPVACTAMEGASFVICTTADDSYAAECESGYYNLGWYYEEENGCAVCPAVEHAAAVSCLGPDDSVAVAADPGYYMDGDILTACTPVDGASFVVCTNAHDSVAAADPDSGGFVLFDECNPADDKCDDSLVCHKDYHICVHELSAGAPCIQGDDVSACGPMLSCVDGVCQSDESVPLDGPIDCTGVNASLPCHAMLLVDEVSNAKSLHDIDRDIYCPCQFVREHAADWSPEVVASCPGGGR